MTGISVRIVILVTFLKICRNRAVIAIAVSKILLQLAAQNRFGLQEVTKMFQQCRIRLA